MKKRILLITIVFSLTIGGIVFAQNNSTSTAILIEQLKQKIATLQEQITQLQEKIRATQQTRGQIKEIYLELKNQLRQGMTSEDVKLLQEFLATDPEIYPERLITGYFGPLTKKAVERFQKKNCLPSDGQVGTTTLWQINELLREGAGNSGKIPKGLLRAPGILKKFCATSTSTTTSENIPLLISDVLATSTSSSTAQIIWKTNEKANSKVYYSTITPVDPFVGTTLTKSNDFLVKNHFVKLTGLTANTTYYFFVVSVDSSGKTATSSEHSFVVLAE